MTNITKNILKALGNIYSCKPVSLHEPTIGSLEKYKIIDCINSGYVSYVGEYVDKFENLLNDYTKSSFTIVTSSGTSALHLALSSVDIKKDRDKPVKVTAFVTIDGEEVFLSSDE